MKRVLFGLIGTVCLAGLVERCGAITVNETGAGPSAVVQIDCPGVGQPWVNAGVLQLDVNGLTMDAFCIDPFHFSSGTMSGYQQVGLTSAPKGNLMNADTALLLERLWGSYYSPSMTSQNAAGLQIAIWELVAGGQGFALKSPNDFGAAGFLSAVENPNYDGPVADLVALTGPGQDYAIESASINALTQSVPDTGSTLALLLLASCGLLCVPRREFRLAPVRV